MRKLAAEFLGTFLLVFLAVGSAVFGFDRIGAVGVALAFGLVLLALVYAIGPISGCHVNPAVTLGVLLARRIGPREAVGYWVVQILGAITGSALITGLTWFGKVKDQTGALGTNSWGTTVSGSGAFVVEVVLTFLFVLVVLLVTNRPASAGFAGLAIGLSLAVVHLAGIPLTGTSVNPARSIGPALFESGQALTQLWLFIVAPLIGAAIAAAVAALLAVAEITEVQAPGLGGTGVPTATLDRANGPGRASHAPAHLHDRPTALELCFHGLVLLVVLVVLGLLFYRLYFPSRSSIDKGLLASILIVTVLFVSTSFFVARRRLP